jgi:hypothetical protein
VLKRSNPILSAGSGLATPGVAGKEITPGQHK